MAVISKRYLNELCQKRIINDSLTNTKLLYEDLSQKEFDIFFSYSYSDKEYAIKLVNLLEKHNFSVYIDLRDPKLNRSNVDRETAERISNIMNRCKCLVYMHTASSKVSKWCPWELGYMTAKTNFRCATILLTEDKEEFPRQEYLEIYPYLRYEKIKDSNEFAFWAHELDSDKYIIFDSFITGQNPFKHQ